MTVAIFIRKRMMKFIKNNLDEQSTIFMKYIKTNVVFKNEFSIYVLYFLKPVKHLYISS